MCSHETDFGFDAERFYGAKCSNHSAHIVCLIVKSVFYKLESAALQFFFYIYVMLTSYKTILSKNSCVRCPFKFLMRSHVTAPQCFIVRFI